MTFEPDALLGRAAGDADLARLALLDAEGAVALAPGGRLVSAARRAVATGLDVRGLSARVLSAALAEGAVDHHLRASTRREIELASRILDPPVETPAPEGAELTVVVPAHDVGPWIAQTLDSLADQAVRLDLVVVADHCTDETLQVVRSAAGSAPLRIVESRLPGGAHARNLGAALAAAPRLAFCDGDDLVPRGAHRTLVDASEASGAALTVGSFLKFRPDHTWSPARRHEAYLRSATYDDLSQAPTLLFHRACWNKVFLTPWWREHDIVFPEVARSNDIVPMTRAYVEATPISVVEDFVYLYRDRPGLSSMSSKVGTERSLRSYLDQEIQCAGILLAHHDAGVRREYAHTVLQEDAWIQVGRYLRQCALRSRAPHADVLERCRRLVRMFDEDLLTRMPLSARLTFAASARGLDELAMLAAMTDDREPATTRAAGWAGVLERGVPEDPLFPPPGDLWRHGLLPTLDDLLDDDTLPVDDTCDALARLGRVLDSDAAWPAWLHHVDVVVRQALERCADPAALAEHVGLLRRACVRVDRVERHGAGRIRVVGAHPGGDRVAAVQLLDPDGGLHEREVSATQAEWSADVATDSLPIGRLRLAATLEDSASGLLVLAHLRHRLEPLPALRRSDRLRVHPDIGPANLVVEHRPPLLRRALRHAGRLPLRQT